MKDVSVVIPHCGNREVLYECLCSIPPACGGLSYEVIIVDNSEEGLSSEFSKGCSLIRNTPGATINRSWNQGCNLAKGKVIAVVNDDIVFGVRALEICVEAMGAFGVPVIYPKHTAGELPSNFAELSYCAAKAPLTLEGPPEFRGFAFLLTRACYCETGPFDEQFQFFYGDDDYWFRLILAKRAPRELQNAYVHHYEQATTKTIGTTKGTWLRGVDPACTNMFDETGERFHLSESAKLKHKWLDVTGQELIERMYGKQAWGQVHP